METVIGSAPGRLRRFGWIALATVLEIVPSFFEAENWEKLLASGETSFASLFDSEARISRFEPSSHASEGGRRTGERSFLLETRFELGGDSAVSVELLRRCRFGKHEEQIFHILAAHFRTACERLDRIQRLSTELTALAQRPGGPKSDGKLASTPLMVSLTPRQRQVVRLVGDGRTNGETATELGVSVRTVEKHLESVFEKLGLENRFQLIAEVRRGVRS